jgi:hypothetical protein
MADNGHARLPGTGPRLEIAYSRGRALVALLVFAAGAGGCYFVTTLPDPATRVAWLGVALFGLMFLVALRAFARTGPQIVIDDRGIESVGWFGLIEWDDITAVERVSFKSHTFLSIRVADPEKYKARLTRRGRRAAEFNERFGLSPFTLSFQNLTHSIDEAWDFVDRHYLAGPPDEQQVASDQACGPSPGDGLP